MISATACPANSGRTAIVSSRDSDAHSAAWRRASSVIGVVRTGDALRLAAVRAPIARPQPRPGDAPGEALIVEPGRLVAGDPRRQDLGLPGAGRGLEAFELADQDFERVGPFHPRLRRDALPAEQKAQKVARSDRLDLGAQPVDGVAVDAGEQPALAPFLGGGARA